MQEKYSYALLHFFKSTPCPRYWGIIVRVEKDTKCPPIFNNMYGFQWIETETELDASMLSPKGVIEEEDNLKVSTMYYIAKRLRPEQVSHKEYIYICGKDRVLRKKKVVSYMRENNLHLIQPYVAEDMKYEVFIPATTPKEVCIPWKKIFECMSSISLDAFEHSNPTILYYNE